MRKISLNLKQRFSLAGKYVREHKVIFTASLLAFFSMCLNVYFEDAEFFYDFTSVFENAYSNLSSMFFMAFLIAIPVTLMTERLSPLKKYLLQILIPVAATFLLFMAGKLYQDGLYMMLYYIGFATAVAYLSLFLFAQKTTSKAYYALVLKRQLFSSFLAFILFAVMFFLLFGVQNLFNLIEKTEPYQCMVLFFTFVFETNLFLYYLFYRRDEESSGRFFKLFLLYILLPAFAVFLAYIYGYTIKSLVLKDVHRIQISSYVTLASFYYISLYFLLREFDQSLFGKIFYRFASFALIPLLIVQIVFTVIRLNSEGLSPEFYAEILCIIFSTTVVSFTFVEKGIFMKYVPVFFAFMFLLGSVSPINLLNLPYKTQLARMMSVLNKYDMYDAEAERLNSYDTIELNEKMTEKDRKRLYSSYCYLVYETKLPLPQWIRRHANSYQDHDESFYEFFDFYAFKRELKTDYFYDSDPHPEAPKEAEYSKIKKFNVSHDYSGSGRVIIKTDYGEYDVSSYLLDAADYGKRNSSYWYSPDDRVRFLFTEMEFNYYPYARKISECNLKGYICYR